MNKIFCRLLIFFQVVLFVLLPSAYSQTVEEDEFQELSDEQKHQASHEVTQTSARVDYSPSNIYKEFIFTKSWLLILLSVAVGLTIIFQWFRFKYVFMLGALFFLGFKDLICFWVRECSI